MSERKSHQCWQQHSNTFKTWLSRDFVEEAGVEKWNRKWKSLETISFGWRQRRIIETLSATFFCARGSRRKRVKRLYGSSVSFPLPMMSFSLSFSLSLFHHWFFCLWKFAFKFGFLLLLFLPLLQHPPAPQYKLRASFGLNWMLNNLFCSTVKRGFGGGVTFWPHKHHLLERAKSIQSLWSPPPCQLTSVPVRKRPTHTVMTRKAFPKF